MNNKKIQPIEKFYALHASYYFSYPVVDEKGKILYQTNPDTGQILRDRSGRPRMIMGLERFQPVRVKLSQGFLSEAVFDPNTKDPQALMRGEALRELSKQDNIKVLTEDAKDKHENFAAWTEKQKRKEQEIRLVAAETKAAKVALLEQRIKQLEMEKK